MAVLKNVEVRWVQIQSPDTRYEHQWSLDAFLSKEQAEKLEAEAKAANPKGIKIKKDDNGQLFYKFSRKVAKSDGSGENTQPVCKGATIDPATGKLVDLTCLIGNGSKCNIQYNMYSWDNKFGTGAGVDFMGMQVLDLVAFGGSDGDEFSEEEVTDSFEVEDNTTGDATAEKEEYDDEDFS